jgi:hypothetical protein
VRVAARAWLAASVAAASVGSALGVAVERFSLSTPEELARGELDGIAIDADGVLRLAPAEDVLWGPGEGIVWDVEPAGDGGAFVALSSPGRVLRVRSGEPAVAWYVAQEEKMVTAVAADGTGGVYAGVTPGGQILHGNGPDRLEPMAETGAAFVWALARGEGRRLWIGTGAPGGLRSLGPHDETARVVFETGDDPVRCLAPRPDAGVVLGTGGEGRVISVDADGRPFVLLDADEEEIVAVAIAADGAVWALAASGPKQVAAAQPALDAGSVTTVRVTATPPGDDATSPSAEAAPSPAPIRRFSAPPGGVLYRISPDGGWRKVWDSAQETAFGLALDRSGSPVVATGDRGRLHTLDASGRSAALVRISSEQASAIAAAADGALLVGGTTDAQVVQLGPRLRTTGSYETPAIDAGGVARWGRVEWRANVPAGATLAVSARSGNTAEPDATWTDYRPLVAGDDSAAVDLPPTRFLQVKLELAPGRDGASPALHGIEARWLPHNRPPELASVGIDPPGTAWSVTPVPTPRATGPTVADDPVSRRMAAAGNPMPGAVRKGWELGSRTVWWTATDPDGDALASRSTTRVPR